MRTPSARVTVAAVPAAAATVGTGTVTDGPGRLNETGLQAPAEAAASRDPGGHASDCRCGAGKQRQSTSCRLGWFQPAEWPRQHTCHGQHLRCRPAGRPREQV